MNNYWIKEEHLDIAIDALAWVTVYGNKSFRENPIYRKALIELIKQRHPNESWEGS